MSDIDEGMMPEHVKPQPVDDPSADETDPEPRPDDRTDDADDQKEPKSHRR